MVNTAFPIELMRRAVLKRGSGRRPERETVLLPSQCDLVSRRAIQSTESGSCWSQTCMTPWPYRSRRTRRGNVPQGAIMLNAIANFFRGLFGRKADNFKDLLIADLGIER